MRTLIFILGLVVAVPGVAQAEVTFEWVTVGDPGNAADDTGHGAVDDIYVISKYEVTNAQYAEFLNAVAATDPHELYSTHMGSGLGGITRGGSSDSYTYEAMASREQRPVNHVSFYDALRFTNWLYNGQPAGAQDPTTTEDGAYTIIAENYLSGPLIFRNPGATTFLPSEDEWYKAAYYDAPSASYLDYPAGSDASTSCAVPGAAENTANCNQVVGDLTDVGSYTGSVGPNGTFDQGGNVWEWNEAIITESRGLRGGSLTSGSFRLGALFWDDSYPEWEAEHVGFRVASIPEPTQILLHACALGTLALLRRRARSDQASVVPGTIPAG
jgi:formylglycine-generating enzyme required for sulfatase activity